jgi:putative ABC transport system permease protein
MLAHTLRHAFAVLVRDRRFTAAAVLTLALGVGANVAVFSVIEAVLLRPLPYPDAGALAIVTHRDLRSGLSKEFVAIGDLVDLAARQAAFEQLVPYNGLAATIVSTPEPVPIRGLSAGSGLFETLRVQPSLGRFFTPADTRPGAAPVAVLGYDLWQRSFGADPAVIGRRVRIDQIDREIVGIAPPGFRFPPAVPTEVIVPASIPLTPPPDRKASWTLAIGRLAPGRALGDAAANLASLSRQMERDHPASNQGSRYAPVSLHDALVGETRPALQLLFGAVGVLLLIACANVAHLLLVRGMNRRHELAVRVALGAGRLRLFTQLAAENLLLSLVAGAVGLTIAHWGVPALIALVPPAVSVPGLAEAGINETVLGYTLAIALIASLAFSVLPALMPAMHSGMGALTGPARAGIARGVTRASSALIVGEIALAVTLLFAAGLVLKSFSQQMSVDPGFRTDHVLTVDFSLPADRYADQAAGRAFFDRVTAALRSIGDVEEAGAAMVTPLTGNNWTVPFQRADRPVPNGERPPDVGWQLASGGYFRALRIPLRSGRLFDAGDRPGKPTVVIVSEAVERRFFAGGKAVGARIKLGDMAAEIVGVVGNIRRAALTDQPRADLYFPMEQAPIPTGTFFLRTAGDPSNVAPAVRETLRRLDPQLLVLGARPFDAIAVESAGTVRLALWLLGVFAWIAVGLAAVGIYAIMSAAVRQRTWEIGTRMAIGATRGRIMWLVLRRGVALIASGTLGGALAAIATGQALTPLLYRTSTSDPAILTVSLVVLAAVALAACVLPAVRAARLDPARLLQQQG